MGSVQSFETPKSRGGRPGKIDAPLNKKLSEVKWGEYRLGDLFEVNSYTKRFDANKVIVLEDGKYPYVVRMSNNNGQKGYIDEDEIYLNEGNTISFGQDTATMFYQERPYFTGDKIKILKAKFREFDKSNAQFFLTTMAKSFESFSWGRSSFSVDIIEKQIISLPVKGGTIDFDFISSFIAELEAERIKELEAHLTVTGLKDYILTEEEHSVLDSYEDWEWNTFNLEDLFGKSTRGKRLKSADRIQFDYSKNFYAKDADALNIQLPSRGGRPDYECMATFISAVQKIVIKDVVLFADRKIGMAKEIVNK